MTICLVILIILENVYTISSEEQGKRYSCPIGFIKNEINGQLCSNSIEKDNQEEALSVGTESRSSSHSYKSTEILKCCDEGNSQINKHDHDSITATKLNILKNNKPGFIVKKNKLYPAKRNMARGIGQFLYQEIGKNYGDIIGNYSYKHPDCISKSHCMIEQMGALFAIPCDEINEDLNNGDETETFGTDFDKIITKNEGTLEDTFCKTILEKDKSSFYYFKEINNCEECSMYCTFKNNNKIEENPCNSYFIDLKLFKNDNIQNSNKLTCCKCIIDDLFMIEPINLENVDAPSKDAFWNKFIKQLQNMNNKDPLFGNAKNVFCIKNGPESWILKSFDATTKHWVETNCGNIFKNSSFKIVLLHSIAVNEFLAKYSSCFEIIENVKQCCKIIHTISDCDLKEKFNYSNMTFERMCFIFKQIHQNQINICCSNIIIIEESDEDSLITIYILEIRKIESSNDILKKISDNKSFMKTSDNNAYSMKTIKDNRHTKQTKEDIRKIESLKTSENNGDSMKTINENRHTKLAKENEYISNKFGEIPIKIPEYNFVNKNNTLDLTFYDYANLIPTESGIIFCMSDGYENVLVKRLDTKEFVENYTLKLIYTPITSGHYWCEVFQINTHEKITTNQIWVFTENVYPMEITIKYKDDEDPTLSEVAYIQYIRTVERIYNRNQGMRGIIKLNIKIKWMETIWINEVDNVVQYFIHICTNIAKDHEKMFHDLNERLPETISKLDYIQTVSEIRSSLFCMETSTEKGDFQFTWKQTRVGDLSESIESCLNDLKLIRKCGGDYFKGGFWEEAPDCDYVTSTITGNLSEILNSNLTTPEMIEALTDLTTLVGEFETIDVYLASSILEKANHEEVDLKNATLILSNLMLVQFDTLKNAQSTYNATDRVLYNFDLILSANKNQTNDLLIQTENLITFTFDCNSTDYLGLALIHDNGFIIKPILRNESFDELTNIEGLEVLAYLSKSLIHHLSEEHPKIIINLFLNNALFNENEERSVSKNVGILLDKQRDLPGSITLLFNQNNLNLTSTECAFWNYGYEKEKPIFGNWKKSGEAKIYKNYQQCDYQHVTHFGLLLSDKKIVHDTLALEIITHTGCSLSMIGFLGIFATAILFKSWRKNRGNTILLHYSLISCFQIILLYLSAVVYETNSFTFCILVGSLLHYTLISQFCWMLIISYLQYKRYVTVFLGSQKYMLIKSFAICYFFPIVPITVLLTFYKDNYTKGHGGICYPTGNGLIFGVLLPISLVVIFNVLIFVRIIFELFCLKRNKCIDDGNIFLLRLRLVVLMFFMLGVTWGLGFAAQIFESSFFLYAFCSTASLQGFVIFIFFVVFNKNTRSMYVYMWRKYNYT